jgi:hypothetical protein
MFVAGVCPGLFSHPRSVVAMTEYRWNQWPSPRRFLTPVGRPSAYWVSQLTPRTMTTVATGVAAGNKVDLASRRHIEDAQQYRQITQKCNYAAVTRLC